MKITNIRTYALQSPLERPFAFSQGRVRRRSATLVKVLTDEGISGWGEAFAQGPERYDLLWYEEPVAPEDIEGYREVQRALSIPIAGGENEHTLFGFRELLGARCVDVAQPDIGSAGGFAACRHIIALAQAHGVQVNPHVWGSAIAQAASVQLIAAVPVAHHSVFAQEPILEYHRSSHPFRARLVAQPTRSCA